MTENSNSFSPDQPGSITFSQDELLLSLTGEYYWLLSRTPKETIDAAVLARAVISIYRFCTAGTQGGCRGTQRCENCIEIHALAAEVMEIVKAVEEANTQKAEAVGRDKPHRRRAFPFGGWEAICSVVQGTELLVLKAHSDFSASQARSNLRNHLQKRKLSITKARVISEGEIEVRGGVAFRVLRLMLGEEVEPASSD